MHTATACHCMYHVAHVSLTSGLPMHTPTVPCSSCLPHLRSAHAYWHCLYHVVHVSLTSGLPMHTGTVPCSSGLPIHTGTACTMLFMSPSPQVCPCILALYHVVHVSLTSGLPIVLALPVPCCQCLPHLRSAHAYWHCTMLSMSPSPQVCLCILALYHVVHVSLTSGLPMHIYTGTVPCCSCLPHLRSAHAYWHCTMSPSPQVCPCILALYHIIM